MTWPVPDAAAAGAPNARVLVVDDYEAVSAAFARILTKAGFSVVRAENGEAAAERLGHESFDVILSDVAMPGLDGIGLLRTVRERDLDVPVLLVSGNPTIDTALKAVEYGALRYLRKPIAPADLVEEVGQAARLSRMARLKRGALDFSADPRMQLGDRAGLEICFERALGALFIAYQPIVQYSTQSVVAYEALLRSSEPKLPQPEAILSAAERLGRLPALGRAVRRSVGTTVGPTDVPLVFVNLHPRDLLDDELFERSSPLAQIAPRVVLEVTERASLHEVGDVRDRIAGLRGLGFRIAIDDMGAGYAGLTSIAQLEPDVMKIDMSLVRDIDREDTKRKLVASMTSLCREMQLQVVAEGVETAAERDSLARLGCDLMQGYLFARPGRDFPAASF